MPFSDGLANTGVSRRATYRGYSRNRHKKAVERCCPLHQTAQAAVLRIDESQDGGNLLPSTVFTGGECRTPSINPALKSAGRAAARPQEEPGFRLLPDHTCGNLLTETRADAPVQFGVGGRYRLSETGWNRLERCRRPDTVPRRHSVSIHRASIFQSIA